jgi:hypothetical protein
MSIFARFTLALVTTAVTAFGGVSLATESPSGPGGCCPQVKPMGTVQVDRIR